MSSNRQIRLSETDQAVLDLIRHRGSASISDLCEYLGVTATAIRQRFIRLAAGGLLERFEDRRGRGRPVHLYRLTDQGLGAMGENLSDLAEALWSEVLAISDPQIRNSVIDGVLNRLVAKYRGEVTGETVTERLRSIADIFRQRRIPFEVENTGSQASLKIVGCPYPRLNSNNDEICRFEQRLVGELLDLPVALNHCQCDASGGKCCTFSAESQAELNQLTVKPSKSATVSK